MKRHVHPLCMNSTEDRERGRSTCGATAASDWLEKHRPKVALHPSMTDYCDSCKHFKEQLSRNQAIMNRYQQSGNATESELQALQETRQHLEEEQKTHKEVATKSQQYYNASKEKCKQQWREITELTGKAARSTKEREDLAIRQHCFTLAISADYQQSKLIPSWGKTEQPGSTYYLQKVSHYIFGIMDCAQGGEIHCVLV